MRGGDISAMNMGETTEARPIPTPPRKRKRLKLTTPLGIAVPTAPAANSRPATIRVRFRPQRSPSGPPTSGPAMQPSRALPMASPT